MELLRPALIALALLAACRGADPVKHRAAAGDVAIVGATVLPLDRPETLSGHTVLLRGRAIVAVAPAAEVDTRVATVIDAQGGWLLPGLADMHVHLLDETDLLLFLLNGVTTVRNLFGSPEHLRWRDAIARGERDGPTLITAGPILDGAPPVWPGSAVVTVPAEARAEVRAQKKAGYDWIKVYNGLSADSYQAILEEAKAQGLPVGGHVPAAVGVDKVLGGGQRSIEHLDGYVPFFGATRVDAAIVTATARAEIWNCPTLVVMERFARMDDPNQLEVTRGLDLVSAIVREAWKPENDFRLQKFTPERFAEVRRKNELRRQLVGDLARADARIVLGTDTGNPYVVPGFAVHDELALLVGAGLKPEQALRAATVNAAALAGAPGAFGAIAPGARADLVLVARDPRAHPAALAEPTIVIAAGKVHRRADLLAAIEKARRKPRPEDRFAGLPALEPEGTALVSARYEVLFRGQVIGGERAVLSQDGKKARVVQGQAVYEMPMRIVVRYRGTRDSLELTQNDEPVMKVSRQGGKVVGAQGDRAPVALEVAPDAVVAPQTIAEFFWYAESLADLGVGKTRTLTAAEVRTETGLRLEPGSFRFTRLPDAEGRRRYEVAGKNGDLDLTGSLSVDADGAPHEVTAKVKFGEFTTRRTP